MRLTVSLEGNAEGKVLASVDMEEIVKMTITDDIEKSNFNPQMFKACTDTSYQCGYQQGRADAIDEVMQIVQKIKDDYNDSKFGEKIPINYGTICGIIIALEQLKEQK